MNNEEIKNEIAQFMRETTPVEKPTKSKKPLLLKVVFVSLAGILIFALSITYDPQTTTSGTDTAPKYHPIEKSHIEITVKAASADDVPRIRIGPGCSMFQTKPKVIKTDYLRGV